MQVNNLIWMDVKDKNITTFASGHLGILTVISRLSSLRIKAAKAQARCSTLIVVIGGDWIG